MSKKKDADRNLLEDAEKMGIDLSFTDDDSNNSTVKPVAKPQTASNSTNDNQNKTASIGEDTEKQTDNTDNVFETIVGDSNESQIVKTILKITDVDDQTTQTKAIYGQKGNLINFQSALSGFLNNNYLLENKADLAKQTYEMTTIDVALAHKKEDTVRTKKVTETVKFVFSNNHADLKPTINTLFFKQQGTKDLVNGLQLWSDQTQTKTFPEVKVKTIPGYDNDLAQIKAIDIAVNSDNWHDNLNIVKTVTFDPQPRNIIIRYLDQTSGAKTDKTIPGFVDMQAKYSTKPVIQAFLKQGGFELIKDETVGHDLRFKETGNSVYQVIFRHKFQTLTSNNSIFKKTGHNYQDQLVKTIKRTIILNADKKQVQKVHFTRNAIGDLATGDIKFQEWRPEKKIFPEFSIPHLPGYTTKEKNVPALTVSRNDSDTTVNIKYLPKKQIASIVLFDDTIKEQITTHKIAGFTGETLDYDFQRDARIMKNSGYVINDQSFKPVEDFVFPASDRSQTLVLKFKHAIRKISLDNPINPKTGDDFTDNLIKIVTRKIKFNYPESILDFPQDPEITQSLTFTRSATIDMASEKVTYGEYSANQEFEAVKVPQIKGYDVTPHLTVIPAKKVSALSKNAEITLQYSPEPRTVILLVQDETANKLIGKKTLKGYVNEELPLNNDKLERLYINKGYEIVKNEFADMPLFDIDKPEAECHVIVKHRFQDLDLAQPINPVSKNDMTKALRKTAQFIVKYQFRNGKQAAPDNVQTVELNRDGVVDLVNGRIKYHAWQAISELEDVASPVVKSYTADQNTIEFDSNNITSTATRTVTYYINKQRIELSFVNQDQHTVKHFPIEVAYQASSKHPLSYYIDQITDLGYAVNDNTDSIKLAYDKTASDTRNYIINVHETFLTNTDTKRITRKINFVLPDDMENYIIQIAVLKRKVTISNVTGKTKETPWSNGFWSGISVPTVPGYQPSLDFIQYQKVDQATKNMQVDVRYFKSEETAITPAVKKQKVSFMKKFLLGFKHKKQKENIKALPAGKNEKKK